MVGLVFSGGGGKGAYEIGVWKALREYGYAQNVTAVSGTSVGGLNGALFVQGDLQVAEGLWQNISPDKILKINASKLLGQAAALAAFPTALVPLLTEAIQFLNGHGWFSRTGLAQLIEDSAVCRAVRQSDLPFYVCALDGNSGKLEYPRLNGLPEAEIALWLQASAAIPLIFGAVEIGKRRYHDGGVLPGLSDNTPIKPLIEQHQCRHLIVVHLHHAPLIHQHRQTWPDVQFWDIVPSVPLGQPPFAPLDFSAQNARELIELGYADTVKSLARFAQFQQQEAQGQKIATDIAQSGQCFHQRQQQGQVLRHTRDALPSPTDLDWLEADIDRAELELIDLGVSEFLRHYSEGGRQLQEAMFAGITTLAATEGRIHHQMNQGLLGRIWSNLSGRTNQQTGEIQWDLQRALYFNQRMIAQLAQRNTLSLEAIAALGSRINYLMAHQNYQHAHHLRLRQAIGELGEWTRRRIGQLQDRLDQHEQRLQQLEQHRDLSLWFASLPKKLAELDAPGQVLELALGFYRHTEGDWCPEEFQALEGHLQALLHNRLLQPVCSLAQLAQTAQASHPPLPAERFPPPDEETIAIHPAYSLIHPGTEGGLETLRQQGWETEHPAPTAALVCELLCSMRLKARDAGQSRQMLLEQLDVLQTICQQNDLDPFQSHIESLRQHIRQYRLWAPLVGKFSAGKSTLLNALMEEDLLGVNIAPETAHAVELYGSDQPRCEAVYLDGGIRQAAAPLATLPATHNGQPLWYYRRFLPNPQLQRLGPLVLVDMPGLESTLAAHEQAIANYMERAQVFLGVLSAESPFDHSVWQKLHEAHACGKQVHLVLTKAGRKTAEERRQLVRQIRHFATRMGLDSEVAVTEAGREVDIAPFRTLLTRLAAQFDHYLQARFVPEIQHLQTHIRQRLEQEYHLAHQDDAELKQQMRREQQAFVRLRERHLQAARALENTLGGAAVEQVLARVAEALSAAESQLLEAAEAGSLRQTAAAIVRPVVQAEARQALDQTLAQYRQSLEQEVSVATEMNLSLAVMVPKFDSGSKGWGAAAIAAALGFAFAGPWGAALGAGLGKWLGSDRDKVREQNRRLIHHQVIPTILDLVRQQLQVQFQQTAERVIGQGQRFIDEQQQALEAKRRQMLEELRQKRDTFTQRRQRLQEAREQCQQLASQWPQASLPATEKYSRPAKAVLQGGTHGYK